MAKFPRRIGITLRLTALRIMLKIRAARTLDRFRSSYVLRNQFSDQFLDVCEFSNFSNFWCSWTRCLDAKISAHMWIQKLISTEIETPYTWLIPGFVKFKIECRNSSRKFGQSTGTQQSFKFCKISNWKLKIYRRCPRVPEWWRGPDWSEVILNRGGDKFHSLWSW